MTISLGSFILRNGIMSWFYIEDLLPGKKCFCLIHSGMFYMPILRCG
jgi:hypothetical protein